MRKKSVLAKVKRQIFVFITLLFFLFGFNLLNAPEPIFAEITKTLKACHICDPILPDSTSTPTPDACAIDCLDPEPVLSAKEAQTNGGKSVLPESGTLKIVFYWMDGCPHCEAVMNTTLPQMEQTYGKLVDIQKIELKSVDDVDQLYLLGERFGIEREQIGVPFIIVGDQAISGEEDISKTLLTLIQSSLSVKSNFKSTVPRAFFFIGGLVTAFIGIIVFLFRKRTLFFTGATLKRKGK